MAFFLLNSAIRLENLLPATVNTLNFLRNYSQDCIHGIALPDHTVATVVPAQHTFQACKESLAEVS